MRFRKQKEAPGQVTSIEFEHTMIHVQRILDNRENTRKDKHTLLDYVIYTIKMDLKYTLASAIFYEPEETLRELGSLLPCGYENEHAENINIFSNEKKRISLKDAEVITLPWKLDRLQNQVKNLAREDFVHDSNHMAIYYSGLDLCYVYNGIHSITAGNYFKKGMIEAEVVHAERLFPHVRTDGVHWINAHTGKPTFKVSDFRVALIYELYRIKQGL